MAALLTPDVFIDYVRKSSLIDARRLDEWLGKQNQLPSDPEQVAALFVKGGVLTNFQAKQILKGKYKGFIINNKYKLLEQIGRGGMGVVFMCEHILLHRIVAVKVMALKEDAPASMVERFYREARAAASLNHPNIVRGFDIDRVGTTFFLVMEYVDGTNVQDIVQSNGPLAVDRAAHYTAQIATGLQHAFECGWVHRDIKPANILVSRQGNCQILDMGLARLFGDDADAVTKKYNDQSIMGTADYVSPEQAMNSHDTDIRTDVYSLGASMYFMLSGQPPFPGGSVARKLLAHQTQDPEPIRSRRPEVPEELQAILQKCMMKDPGQRFQTPMEVIEALTPWTSNPIAPPPDKEMPRWGQAVLNVLNATPGSTGPASSTSLPKTGAGSGIRPKQSTTSSGKAGDSTADLARSSHATPPGVSLDDSGKSPTLSSSVVQVLPPEILEATRAAKPAQPEKKPFSRMTLIIACLVAVVLGILLASFMGLGGGGGASSDDKVKEKPPAGKASLVHPSVAALPAVVVSG